MVARGNQNTRGIGQRQSLNINRLNQAFFLAAMENLFIIKIE